MMPYGAKVPDILTALTTAAVHRRAALLEQWLVEHHDCWPGPSVASPFAEPLVRHAKCSCGAELEVTLLILPVVVSTGGRP